MYSDAHCHLTKSEILPFIEEIFRSASKGDVTQFGIGGYDLSDWQRQIALPVPPYIQIVKSFGIHPWVVAAQSEDEVESMWKSLKELSPQCQAIGETGLDFFRDKARSQYAMEVFRRHVTLSKELSKPLVLHIVRAHEDALSVIKELKPSQGGIVHAFHSHREIAKKYVDAGFTLSFGKQFVRHPKFNPFDLFGESHWTLESDAPFDEKSLQSKVSNSGDIEVADNPFLTVLELASQLSQYCRKSKQEILICSTRAFQKAFDQV